MKVISDVTGSNVPRLDCPASNMGHNCHEINLHGVIGNLHTGEHYDRGTLSPGIPGTPGFNL